MGLFDKILPKKEEEKSQVSEGKYSEACALCGGVGTDKKWAGQYWHKKCIRKSKRVAKGMI